MLPKIGMLSHFGQPLVIFGQFELFWASFPQLHWTSYKKTNLILPKIYQNNPNLHKINQNNPTLPKIGMLSHFGQPLVFFGHFGSVSHNCTGAHIKKQKLKHDYDHQMSA